MNKKPFSAPIVMALLLSIVLLGCSTVPITGRRQLLLNSDADLAAMSSDQYGKTLQESTLSQDVQQVALVRKVGERLAAATEAYLTEVGYSTETYAWEFNVIVEDQTVNAWCMPGGKVAVYTGILPLTQDETGLAVVMGHEIAHAIANHGNERMSEAMIIEGLGAGLSVALSEQPEATQNIFLQSYGAIGQVGVMLPHSRKHELEADRIGLSLMARAGYDPRAAVPFWQRMQEASSGQRPPAFLSTHPVPENRIAQIQELLPEALALYRPGS